MIRRLLPVLLLSLLLAVASIAQRSGSGSPRDTGSTGRQSSPTGIPSPSESGINFIVHVIYPNDHPAGESIQVELEAVTGGTISDKFTDPEGRVSFDAVSPGSYILKLRGPDIEDTTSEIITLNSYETLRHEYIHAQPVQSANRAGPPKGVVTAAELNVPGKARKELDKGNAAAAKGEMHKAIQHYQNAIGVYPKYALAYNNLGVAYMNTKDPAQAREAWERALQADPNLPSANANSARLSMLERNYSAAIPLLEKALSAQPTSAEYLLLMAQAQFLSSNFDKALTYCRRIYGVEHQKYELARIIAGRSLEAQNRPDQARIEYEVLIKENPNAPEAAEARKSLARLDSVAKK